MICKKTGCNQEVVKIGLCKRHFYIRNTTYKYIGHRENKNDPEVKRKCLMCDRNFISTGNRRCELCNKTTDCHYECNTTLYVRC